MEKETKHNKRIVDNTKKHAQQNEKLKKCTQNVFE
jgi:hypothetical protein